MMKENRIVVKAPFKERWEAFKKAYYEWARYNPYKEGLFLNGIKYGMRSKKSMTGQSIL